MLKKQNTGDSKTHLIDMVWDGDPYTPSGGAVITFTARLGYFSKTSVILLDDVTHAGAVASVVITKEIAERVTAAAPLYCDVQVQEGAEVKTVAAFRMKFNPDVSKRFNRTLVLAVNALTFDGEPLTFGGENLTFG